MAERLSSKRAKDMLDEVTSTLEDCNSALQARLPTLIENTAFYRGLQWGISSPVGWIQDNFDLDEAREVLNYVRPTVRTAVADMLRNIPNPEVVAASDDQLSVARAMASQRLCRSILRNGVFPFEQLVRGETAAQIHGACLYKVFWDPNKGRYQDMPAVDPATGQPELDPFGVPRIERRAEGEIRVEFVDVISGLVDVHARCEDEIRHIFHRKILPSGLLDDHFPYDYAGSPTKGRWMAHRADFGYYGREILENDARAYDIPDDMKLSARSTGNELCELVEYWEKPSNTYPNGRLIVFSGDVIVAIGPLPYEWPWVLRLGQNIMPSGLYPDGVVTDIIPLQRTINLNASKKREWMDKILSPPLLNPNGSGIDKSLFSDMAGEVIDYNEGYRPEWMAVPEIPSSMFTLEDHLVSILQTISTYSDISRGEPPQGYDSGRALAYLYEFQKGVHEPDVHLFRQDVGRILTKCLRLARDFYQEGRVVRLIGENNRWMQVAFQHADYDMEAEVVVEAFSGKPNSRALRFAEAVEVMQLQGFADTPDAKRFRQIIDMDVEDRSTTQWNEAHRGRARGEQVAILTDPFAPIEVLYQDDHDLHLEEHNLFRISQQYLSLPLAARERFDQHCAHHEMIAAEQTQAYADEQAMLAGNSQSPTGGPPAEKPGMAESPADGGHGAYPESADLRADQDLASRLVAA